MLIFVMQTAKLDNRFPYAANAAKPFLASLGSNVTGLASQSPRL